MKSTEITKEFIEKYATLCPSSMAAHRGIDPTDKKAMAIFAYNLLNPDDVIVVTHTFNEVLAWWQNQPKRTYEDYKALLDNYTLLFATNNAKIEGINIDYHTTRELYEVGTVSNYSGTPQDLMSMFNQKLAFETCLKKLIDREPLSKELILYMHKLMMHGCYDSTRYNKGERPGTFKVNDYCVGVSDVGSFPEEVNEDIDDLLEQINSVDSTDVLTIASYFHLQFECIHPFADGNGRVGRLLLNYFLMYNDYPPIIMDAADKEVYYMALEVFDKTGRLDGFISFVKEQAVKAWSNRVK